MCTLVILRRPEHRWPVIIGANRDEMIGRPALPPARHWPDRPEIIAGRDLLAGGSWLGVNDWGVAAAVLNRHGSLGPAPGQRSRGELVLEALDHPDAVAAAEALSHLDPAAYRTFNLIVADNRDAFWLRHADGANIDAWPIPEGLSLIDSGELNRPNNRRVTLAAPRFRAAHGVHGPAWRVRRPVCGPVARPRGMAWAARRAAQFGRVARVDTTRRFAGRDSMAGTR